jgi:hypothetical protein
MTPGKIFQAGLLLLVLVPPLALRAEERGEGKLDPSEPKGITSQEIIERFAAKEKQFKQARDQYTYRQDITVQTLDGDTITGEFRTVEDVVFDDKGRRIEHVMFAPQSTLRDVILMPEDMDDMRHRLPFVLTSDEIGEYGILYVGQQHEDELQTYVFDIAPKQIEKGKRYFQGRIWVDNQDFQIVKTDGKTVPDIRSHHGNDENLFPKFKTWREQIDGQYWFPTYTYADDILHFKAGDVHIREKIKYTNYQRFGSSVKITFQGQEVQKGESGSTDKKPETPKN